MAEQNAKMSSAMMGENKVKDKMELIEELGHQMMRLNHGDCQKNEVILSSHSHIDGP